MYCALYACSTPVISKVFSGSVLIVCKCCVHVMHKCPKDAHKLHSCRIFFFTARMHAMGSQRACTFHLNSINQPPFAGFVGFETNTKSIRHTCSSLTSFLLTITCCFSVYYNLTPAAFRLKKKNVHEYICRGL